MTSRLSERPPLDADILTTVSLAVYIQTCKAPKVGELRNLKTAWAVVFHHGRLQIHIFNWKINYQAVWPWAKLDGLIESAQWECENLFPAHDRSSEVTECVLYFVAGYVARKFKQSLACQICKSAFTAPKNQGPAAELVNLKSRGWLTYPNKNWVKIFMGDEMFFSEKIRGLCMKIDRVRFNDILMTFPCIKHKEDVVANVPSFTTMYQCTCMCQHCRQSNTAVSREKEKIAKHCIT